VGVAVKVLRSDVKGQGHDQIS